MEVEIVTDDGVATPYMEAEQMNAADGGECRAVVSDKASPDTLDNSCTPVPPLNHDSSTTSDSSAAVAVNSPVTVSADAGPVETPTTGCSLERGASVESSTHCSSTASVDTVKSVHHATPAQQQQQQQQQVCITEQDDTALITSPPLDTVTEGQSDITQLADDSSPPAIPPTHQEPDHQQEQPQQEELKENVPVEDFRAGMTCTDAPTAIDVLNTRYRLADVTIHRNMITWSSWNVADIVRGPHRESFWWRGRRAHRKPVEDNNSSDKNECPDEDEHLALQDVEEVCSKIERREREIAQMLDKMDRDAAALDVITPETAQHQQQACHVPSQHQTSSSQSDKRSGNVFQRLLRALRKRFARQQQQQPHHHGDHHQQQQQVTAEQQHQRQQAIQRRQRTL